VDNQTSPDQSEIFESQLKRLICAYLEVISAVDAEPSFTIRGFFLFYLKLYWWYLNFFFLPLVFVLDVFIFVVNLFRKRKFNYVKGVFINYTISALRALHRGDIPILKLLTLRYFTRLFVSYHVRRRIRVISTFLQGRELRSLFAIEEDAEGLSKTKDDIDRLSKLDGILSKSVELKLFLTIASYWGLVTAGLKFFGVETKAASFRSLLDKTMSRESVAPIMVSVILLSFTIVLLGFFGLLSSFVRKRELTEAHDIYEIEGIFFGTEKISRPREFPLDIIGWSICLSLFFWPILLQPPQSSDFLIAIIVVVLLFGSLSYALFRRWRLGNY